MRPPIKLNLKQPKYPDRRRPSAPASSVAHDLAAKLVKLHREYAGIGPLLFAIKHHQEIRNCPGGVKTILELAKVGDYEADISKGKRLAAHVLVRGDTE